MTALNSSSDTKILCQIQNIQPVSATYGKSVVFRAIINNNIVIACIDNGLNRRQNRILFIICGNYHKNLAHFAPLTSLLAWLFP